MTVTSFVCLLVLSAGFRKIIYSAAICTNSVERVCMGNARNLIDFGGNQNHVSLGLRGGGSDGRFAKKRFDWIIFGDANDSIRFDSVQPTSHC